MRKILVLLMVAMLLPLTVNAQAITPQSVQMQRSPYALKTLDNRFKAPARISLPSNQRILGHYDTDDIETGGYLGLTNFPGTIPTGVVFDKSQLSFYDGGKIVSIRVGLSVSTTVSRVFVIPILENGQMGTAVATTCSVSAMGWNMVSLTTPYQIDLSAIEGLMIGFDYRQTSSNYPLSYVELGEPAPTYCYITYNGQTGWFNVGTEDYGNLSLQCVVEKDDYPDYFISMLNLFVPGFVQQGTRLDFDFEARNYGSVTLTPGNYTFDVAIDGNVVGTINGADEMGNEYITINGFAPTDGLSVGSHTLTVTTATINGEPVQEPVSLSQQFKVYTAGFARQLHLIEQFTSTYCTYCPLGSAVLKKLLDLRDDISLVCVHQNMNGTDPMRNAQCDTVAVYQGGTSYPSASYNRTAGFSSMDAVANGLGYDAQYQDVVAGYISQFLDYVAETPSFATVNINSKYDSASRQVEVTVDGVLSPEFDVLMGDDSRLTVYLIEDGIVARQYNNGTWETRYIHNNVLRCALGSALGVALNRDGDAYKNVLTYTLPSTWKPENMNVVAFISRPLVNGRTGDYTDLIVNQANKRKLGEFDEPTSLRGDVNSDGKVDVTDVTDLISYILTGNATGIDLVAANASLEGGIDVEDVTAIIGRVLTGSWPE